jgi:hypothetical protein
VNSDLPLPFLHSEMVTLSSKLNVVGPLAVGPSTGFLVAGPPAAGPPEEE